MQLPTDLKVVIAENQRLPRAEASGIGREQAPAARAAFMLGRYTAKHFVISNKNENIF